MDKDTGFESWFHPNPGRKEAEEILLNEGRDGSFLVRYSQSFPGDFVLCVRRGQSIIHFRIQVVGRYYYLYERKFATLGCLVQFYADNPFELSDNGLELKHPLYEEVATERWYHGALAGRDAELLLTGPKGQDGSFLMRTTVHSRKFVLSIRVGDESCISSLNENITFLTWEVGLRFPLCYT